MKKDRTSGRPPMFETPEDLQNKIDEYFKSGIKKRTITVGKAPNVDVIELPVPTISGLCLFLGFESRQSFYDLKKKKEYEDVLSRAHKRINPYSNKAKFNYKSKGSQNERIKERRKLDKNYHLRTNVASLLRHTLKNKNGRKSFDILGYSTQDLRNHLEKLFTKKMNWDNYGSYWEIDHIIPISSFKYTSCEDKEFKDCWSLSNLRPLDKISNMKKGNRTISLPIKKEL